MTDPHCRAEVNPLNLALCLMALLAVSIGTLCQKRFVAANDVREPLRQDPTLKESTP